MNFRKDIIQPTTSYHRASLPHPFLFWSQPWDVQLACCRKDVPPAGPHGSSGPAPLCSFCAMVCGTEIHSSTHTWHLGLGLLGRWSEAPPIRACHAVVSLSSSCLPGTMGRQANKGSILWLPQCCAEPKTSGWGPRYHTVTTDGIPHLLIIGCEANWWLKGVLYDFTMPFSL